MKKFVNSKVVKAIAITGLIYLLYMIVVILTGQKNIGETKLWGKNSVNDFNFLTRSWKLIFT